MYQQSSEVILKDAKSFTEAEQLNKSQEETILTVPKM